MDDFTDDILRKIGIFVDEIKEMELPFVGTSLFKYFSVERRGFFDKPQFRFTQRTALNDPFELSRRWNEIASEDTITHFVKYIQDRMEEQLNDNSFLIERFIAEIRKHQGFVTNEQKATVVSAINDPCTRTIVQETVLNTRQSVPILLKEIFSENLFGKVLSNTIDKIGIFSVSEVDCNVQLWALYASSGSGFAVEINPFHDFFLSKNSKNSLFRAVRYTDDILPTFFNNPLYICFVKNREWSFEKEWRITKELSDADEIHLICNDTLYLFDVQPGMIRSIVFGYNYDETNMKADIERISQFDERIEFKKVALASTPGQLETRPLAA
jgi:hypothetical protein